MVTGSVGGFLGLFLKIGLGAAFPFNGDACSVGPGANRRAARLSTPGTTAHRNSPKQPVTFVTDEMSG